MFAIAFLLLVGQAPAGSGDLDAQLEQVRKQLADESRPVDQRASLALEQATALDRAAQAGATGDERRTRAEQAVALLDEFNAAHPRHALATPLALQAAVYAWADGRRALDASRLAAADEGRKARAIQSFDSAVTRLDRIEPELSGADPLVAQNARFRLAQVLADRASLDPPGSDAERDRLKRGLASLEPPPSEPEIAGFARFLRAEINARLGRLDVAESELNAAAKAKYPPPAEALIEARVNLMVANRRFLDAIKVVEGAGLDDVARAAMAVRVRLAQRKNLSYGQERREVEDELFARAGTLLGSPRPEGRLALLDLAREIDAPSPRAEAAAWDVLAEGALGLGEPKRASRLDASGADRAADRGRSDEAGRLRFKAAAILFQAGDFAGADGLLGRVWADPKAGPSRPKAGMLRALARGRSLANHEPGASRSAYVAALRDQIREYPDDPATPEARWLLGSVERGDGRLVEAVAQWSPIPPSHPRWLPARLAIAEENQRRLDEARIAGESSAVAAAYRGAADFLRASGALALNPADVLDLDLASARLDLTPGVARPELARSLCDRLGHQGGSARQHARARALRIVALAMAQRWQEAEREAHAEIPNGSTEDLLVAIALLDGAAAETPSDVQRSRYGLILRVLTEGMARRVDALPPAERSEAHLRAIRALVFSGQTANARRTLASPASPNPTDLSPALLRDLADTLLRIDAPGLAVDIERLRARSLQTGSAAWLESRYGLALALYRAQKVADARRVIDGTAILHPDLGGGRLKDRFERLRQRIDQD